LAYIFSVICPKKSLNSNKGNEYNIGINESQISSQLLKQLADGYYMRCKAFLAASRPHRARKVRSLLRYVYIHNINNFICVYVYYKYIGL
jgi:hypothetical protein